MRTRRSKSIHKPEVIQESQFEEVEHAETKSDVSDSLEMQITRNENTTVYSAQSVAEQQADGDVSETESNCSAVSGLQTPLIVRVTRRRQIVVPCQLDSADKKRHDRTAFVTKLNRILDEDDTSEAESCSSAVSGVQMPNVTRTTRSRQSKKKLQPDTVPEAQSEDISDAESCCLSSHTEPSLTTKRVTRSMQRKWQAENIKQTEKGNVIVSEDENLIEDTVESEPVKISDSRPAAESSNGNDSFALFLSKDESDESENSDVADIDAVEENLCYEEAGKRTPSFKKSLKNSSLHAEGLFVIDTEPGMSSSQKYYLDQVDQASDAESKHEGSEKGEETSDLEEAEEELIDEDEKDEDDDLLKNQIDVLHLSSSIDPGLNIKKLGGLYISFDAKNQNPRSGAVKQLKEKKKDQLLQKSIITPDFEKKECVPPFRESLHQLKKQRRAERAKTTGDGWFGMKAPEITSELKNDLKVLKMRASLDPKHFYKKNDRDGLPKYFQVGTVVDSPIDFYHSRIPKKQRKRTIVEELLADSEFRRYNKKKYQEILSEKAAFAAGKRNRKKKKFHN
uniref:Deoxynucleotidyltransferase terminal interacting protein 2 n=1 Tax=Calidris pygmaea TaxID=425635 RepID=A0A8C3J4M5_9CHAR